MTGVEKWEKFKGKKIKRENVRICEIKIESIFQLLNWFNGIPESEHQPTTNAKKIKSTDLNFDCMYLIKNQLSLSDLLNVVQAN